MAAYKDLYKLKNDSDFQDKVAVAVVVAAQSISKDSDPPANQAARLVWAEKAMTNPASVAGPMLWAVLAANKTASTTQILAAEDPAIQANVDDAVNLFAGV